jgi:nitroimidazol reductase NimA-like FMN-containing flavoprotein (pyridoxamine 5'-phosphate oxidase superfamily)
MTSIEAHSLLSTMQRDECLALLGGVEVGRLAVVDGGQPLVFPVNYVMAEDSPVFRTAPGTKLRAGEGRPVCLEADAIDPATKTGWSVMVIGWLEEVTRYDPETYRVVASLGVEPWAQGERPHLMRVVARRITGRRILAS